MMTTLSLTIIVNKGEAFELNRCLESLKGDLLDEIIITQTFEDEEVKKVAQKFNAKISFFKWISDFSAARNFNLDQATCEYVFWLDADDVIKPDSYKKLLQLKKELHNYDMIHLPYVYHHDEFDNPHNIHPRERIFKNKDPRFRWQDPIHETVSYNVTVKVKHVYDIFVDHYRMRPYVADRNLTILRKHYNENPTTRIRFYFGKDLFDVGFYDEGVSVLEDYVRRSEGFVDNLAAACQRLSQYYLEAKQDFKTAKIFALQGLSFCNSYAELYYYYADACQKLNEIDTAIKYFKLALTKKFGTAGFSQLPEFYELKPANCLSLLYYHHKKDYVQSLKYNLIALKNQPFSTTLINDNRLLLTHAVKIKIAWLIPQFDLNYPSTRIRRYNIHNRLLYLGIDSTIITNYYNFNIEETMCKLQECQIVIFTQYAEYDFRLIKRLKEKQIKIIFDFCEALFDGLYQSGCFVRFDKIVCCSTKLAEMTNEKGYNNTIIIKDAIEQKNVSHQYENNEKLKAVYMGMGGNAVLAKDMKLIVEAADYELIIISEWDDATIKWNVDTWHEELNKCDVVLCPQRDCQPAKSNVKVTTAMALGLPVIASPLKAYEEIIQHGKNGYLCTSSKEWSDALIELKDENKRKLIGENAKRSINNYMLEPIANQWVQLFFDLTLDKAEIQKTDETVDVIIANYNNIEYLKLCINSIIENTDSPYRIIISDAGSNKETWDYLNTLKGVSIIGQQDKRLNYSQACNEGILRSYSKYFVILNSDVIVSKGWLKNLINKLETVPRLAACGVLSNCDRGWMHGVKGRPVYDMRLPSGVELVPGMKINQINVNELYSFMQTCNDKYKSQYVSQEWVAVYATIFARSAINEVGLFDINFKTGCEDLDLCIRLRKYKYEIGQAIDSFVFHFGGISRGAYELEDNKHYREEDVYNHQYLKQKYTKEKIVIYTGPAFERWNKKKVLQGMAGSETWAMELARAFSKKNYLVTVYIDLDVNDVNEWVIEEDGERYRHYSKLNEDLQYDHVDYFISSRSCDVFSNNVHCMNKYVMIHDIWLSSDPKYDTRQWQVKKFAVLSKWHKEFVMSHHNIQKEKIMLTANGKDLSLYSNVDNVKKKNKIFYSSSLDRGLLELLKIFPILRKNVPDLELVIAYGLYNWEQAIKARGNQKAEVDHLNEIKELMKQPGINYVGRLSKEELAQQQMECKAWLYPTWFWETFCITAVDAGVAKCAIVTSNLAGLKTTIGDAGILIDGDCKSVQYQTKFIEESIKVLTDDKYREQLANKAYNKVIKYTWDRIADNWISEFKGGGKKLNLGCGGNRVPGYIGVDIFKHENVDEIFSMDDIPYADSSIDGLYSEHALEHLSFKQAEKAIKECYRVLKSGCEFILKIPDLELCCHSYLNPPDHILKKVSMQRAKEWYRYTIFGRQLSLSGELDESQIHKSGYSKQDIRSLLENVGFKITSIINYDGWDTPSIEIKAVK